MTKNPVPGRVKTRLIGSLTAEQAAEIHAAFVGDLVEELTQGSFDLRIAWALEGRESAALEILPKGLQNLESTAQEGEDLGERIYHALREATLASPRVAAIGSDHPGLACGLVEQAFDLLDRGAEVVLGPATDGGYYLIAVRSEALDSRLFDGIDWSTSVVHAQTVDRCRQLALRLEQLPEASDVDTPSDLDRLADSLRGGAPGTLCRRSQDLLRVWGRL